MHISRAAARDVWRRGWAGVLFAALFCAAPVQAQRSGLEEAYRDMYNLDFTGAHGVLLGWMDAHPTDPMGPVSDAAAYLFAEFERLGVLDVELFADDSRFLNRPRPASDPSIREAFQRRIRQADDLAGKALAKDPNDADGLLARTLAFGLRSDYAALIDKSDLAAFRLSKQASQCARQALRNKPDLYDAYIATGIENYMLSLKPAPVRWFLGLTGGETDKQTGIRELRVAAEHGHFLAPFARLMLAVAELRDGKKMEARSLLSSLATEFPRNTLYRRQMERISK